MKETIRISLYVGIAFLISFTLLVAFLEMYSVGLLATEKSIAENRNMFFQNPKHVTFDVIRSFDRDSNMNSININSLGFRGDEFLKVKPNNVYRVIMVGGSTVFGTGTTSDYTTIPGYLEGFLIDETHPFDIEVINSGIQGANSYSELEVIKNRLTDFSPDIVIIYDGWNDLLANHTSEELSDNWNAMCELGENNNFEVIIIVQPIAGFGNKSLTQQELEYVKNGKDFNNDPLIDSLKQYDQYIENLEKLEGCTNKIDLRFIFDDEKETIYTDQGHVSEKGNQIVSEYISQKIYSTIPQKLIINAETELQLEKTNITELHDIEESKNTFVETQPQTYKNSEISLLIEVLDLENDDTPIHKVLQITALDKTNNTKIPNVTYFLTISNDESFLLRDYFFTETDVLMLYVFPNYLKSIEISGERQYDNNAYVASKDSPLTISGHIFQKNESYEFNIDIRTLYEKSNWVYSFDNFKGKIWIGS